VSSGYLGAHGEIDEVGWLEVGLTCAEEELEESVGSQYVLLQALEKKRLQVGIVVNAWNG
jgi:hypothetical protein